MENLEDFQFMIRRRPSSSEDLGESSFLLDAKETIDCYLSEMSNSGASICRTLFDFLEGIDKRKKAISVRIVTNINADNKELAMKLARDFDVFHVDTLDGNFCIIDSATYYCYLQYPAYDTLRYSTLLISKQTSFVRLQQNLFENLLNQSKPARDRITEVERRVQKEYVETISEFTSVVRVIRERTGAAGFDVQVLFATTNSFHWAENIGIIEWLGSASSRGVNVKILIKIEDDIMKDTSKQKIKEKYDRINVNFLKQPLKSKIMTFIFDQSYSLTIDLNDNIKDFSSQKTCLATYSNSEARVLADLSMFESLWIQAEREKNQSIRQAYFEIFSGRKLKDETYERNWKFSEK
jgi:hypothetical protein